MCDTCSFLSFMQIVDSVISTFFSNERERAEVLSVVHTSGVSFSGTSKTPANFLLVSGSSCKKYSLEYLLSDDLMRCLKSAIYELTPLNPVCKSQYLPLNGVYYTIYGGRTQ